MKKRIVSVLLVCAMLLGIMLSLASCGEKSKINSAVQKTKALEQLSADVLIDMDVAAGYNSQHHRSIKEVNSVKLDDGTRLTSELSENFGSSNEGQTTYFDKEYAYLPNGTKQSLEEYERYSTVYTTLIDDLLVTLPSRLFEEDKNGYKMAKCEEYAGKLILRVEIDDNSTDEIEAFKGIYASFFDSLVQRVKTHLDCEACMKMKANCGNCGAGIMDCDKCDTQRTACKKCVVENLELEDCFFEIEIKDGYVTRTMVKFEAHMEAGENKESVSACGKIEVRINNPGKEVSVFLPEETKAWATDTRNRRPSLSSFVK